MNKIREQLKDKKRIVVKIGSSSLTHEMTGDLNLAKMEKLIRVLTDMNNAGKEVVLVSSGAIAVGRKTVGLLEKPKEKAMKQACAAVGQAKLMMVYQKLFAEYNQLTAQILMTKHTMINEISRENAQNTFEELLRLGVIPIVNENDTVSTDEIEFGDNDTLSAIVAALIGADLLILLSDIDGLYTDDPRKNPEAKFIDTVEVIGEDILKMAKGAGSSVGTGGMATKISAARIATDSGADMIIANGEDVNVIREAIDGNEVGTIFKAHKNKDFQLMDYLVTSQYTKHDQKSTVL
ncbi:MAG: glutamate 5-kinase [Lachnospiraceae bacterium]|nr:glutamate 5-kinase [Lachnospiraceae bacterium]